MLTSGDRRVHMKATTREKNQVSHELALIARTNMKTAVWLGSGLEGIVNLSFWLSVDLILEWLMVLLI